MRISYCVEKYRQREYVENSYRDSISKVASADNSYGNVNIHVGKMGMGSQFAPDIRIFY